MGTSPDSYLTVSSTGTYQLRNETDIRIGSFGTFRTSLDMNRVLLKNQLAVRILGLYNDEKFQQDPAYNLDKRLYSAMRYEPAFLKKGFRPHRSQGQRRVRRDQQQSSPVAAAH